jgi:hypothetical protein
VAVCCHDPPILRFLRRTLTTSVLVLRKESVIAGGRGASPLPQAAAAGHRDGNVTGHALLPVLSQQLMDSNWEPVHLLDRKRAFPFGLSERVYYSALNDACPSNSWSHVTRGTTNCAWLCNISEGNRVVSDVSCENCRLPVRRLWTVPHDN